LKPILIGNAQGFWGDSVDAPARLVSQQTNLDYLTLDYLAEVSMSILALQKERDPAAGYAGDFVEVVRSLIPFWRKGSKVRVITNAGGLNPQGCAQACAKVLRQAGIRRMKIGVVTGDDVLPVLRKAGAGKKSFNNLETGEPITKIFDSLITANAYLGAQPVADGLAAGADMVITGRVADPSLTVAPCIAEFGWSPNDYDRIAGATIAGHLIECGTQVTGGISTDWLQIPDPANIGFPVVEVNADGTCVVTKPKRTGGVVNERTVKEQLLYEIGDPDNYLSPDVTVSFLSLQVREERKNRVRVSGAKGHPATSSYKVSASYRDGFWAQGTLTIVGRDAVAKARRCGEIILQRVRAAGFEFRRSLIECLGAGAAGPGVMEKSLAAELLETVLRVTVADPRQDAVERFAKEISPLITSGPQGVTGYAAGRPRVHPVFGYWPCLIDKKLVKPQVTIITTDQ
jgi:acyclic terpene utilization AtuA family protein